MNKVYILHIDGEPLTPAKYKEELLKLYPKYCTGWPPPRFTRKAYFERKHAELAVNAMTKGIKERLTIVEYVEKKQ